ncbi:MAG TPA: prolyl oligopeptidase family serine peptidase [Caulobacteraceae bacterium]|nr:prolyl oligopeptidase family serine peptidase [Caulobacteraceae bacterium]
MAATFRRAAGAALVLLTLVPAAGSASAAGVERMDYGGRPLIVYAPARLPPAGQRALVVVLHGGLGNADRIEAGGAEHGLNMDAAADQDGFLVAYVNGTPVTRNMGPQFLGWNAGGGCCGQSAASGVDDVGYITGAATMLAQKYGVAPGRVFVMGHSNGAMMAQRLVCETSFFAVAVAVSGPLNLDIPRCPDGAGHRVLAIHGVDDANVPVKGGVGSKGFSQVSYHSEAASQAAWRASGAAYTLRLVPGADHPIDHIDAALKAAGGQTVAEQAAAFFGLGPQP